MRLITVGAPWPTFMKLKPVVDAFDAAGAEAALEVAHVEGVGSATIDTSHESRPQLSETAPARRRRYRRIRDGVSCAQITIDV